MKLTVNGSLQDIGEIDPATPLLWVLRDRLGLVGTKYGCGIAQCGACTVHLDGRPVRACVMTIQAADGHSVTTIEGLASNAGALTPLQQAWIDLDVPQCGYCQAGQLMSADALLRDTPNPSIADIEQAMAGNLCRCGTYARIQAAILQAAGSGSSGDAS